MARGRVPNGPARATIVDVARAAAVSPATVSRVLSGTKRVAADTEQRVRTAVEQLGYRPNPAAQGLLRGATRTVGVVVPDLGNPYFAEVLKGVTNAAEDADHRTLVADANEVPEAEYRSALELSRWADGVVLCSPRMGDDRLTALAATVPRLICVNRVAGGQRIPAVVVDFRAGMLVLGRHLAGLGHRRLAYLRGPAKAWSEHERQRGLAELPDLGPRVTQLDCGSGSRDGYRVAEAALATGSTAIMAFSDHVAIGVLTRLAELGVPVPGEVSVCGFDDIELSRMVSPGLTTAAVNKPGLGRQAWDLLFGNEPADTVVTVEPELVVRASTAPPAG